MAKIPTSPWRVTLDHYPQFKRAALKVMSMTSIVSEYSRYNQTGLTLPAMAMEVGCDVRRARYVLKLLKDTRAIFVFREHRFAEAKAKMTAVEYAAFMKKFRSLKKQGFSDLWFVKEHFDLMLVGRYDGHAEFSRHDKPRPANYIGMIFSADQPTHSRVTMINYVDNFNFLGAHKDVMNWNFDRHLDDSADESTGDPVADFAKILGIGIALSNLEKNPKRSKLLASHFLTVACFEEAVNCAADAFFY